MRRVRPLRHPERRSEACAKQLRCDKFSFRPTLSIGRRQMRRGKSKAKGLKRGGRIRSAPAKAKTRAGRKDASATGSAKKLAAKLRAYREASASPDEISNVKACFGRSARARSKCYVFDVARARAFQHSFTNIHYLMGPQA